MNERIYNLYNINKSKEYDGMCKKYECDMQGEHGIFKEPLGYGTKDHIVEAVVYKICLICNVGCAFAKVRKTKDTIGVFSRFEIPDHCNFKHASSLFGVNQLHISELLDQSYKIAVNTGNQAFISTIYKYMLIDYLTGQMDRHLDNIAVLSKNKKIAWYKLYDNGLALGANYSNSTAIERLESGFFDSRVGSSSEIKEELLKYKEILKVGDIRLSSLYDGRLYKIVDESDVYNQLGKNRRKAMVEFILRQKADIESW